MTTSLALAAGSGPGETPDNQVLLRGRLAAEAIEKPLPSGDTLLTFRLVVNRPAKDRGRVDSLECVTVRPKVRRTVARALPGDVVEVEGRLQRRFWRGPAGAQSRYAVDVLAARVRKPGRGRPAAGVTGPRDGA